MSDSAPEKKKLIYQVLMMESFVVLVGGSFMATKHYFSDITLIDADTDLYLGYALFFMGLANIFIARNFFNYKKSK